MLLEEFVEDRVFSPARVAAALRTTKVEITRTLELEGWGGMRFPAPRGYGREKRKLGCGKCWRFLAEWRRKRAPN